MSVTRRARPWFRRRGEAGRVGTGCAPGLSKASKDQGRRVAVYADDRPEPGETPVVGDRHRDVVVALHRR